ncbi:M24 family metallopeptidase [candidate division KSB1 bacterium]
MDLARIQAELRKANVDGWLFYDFHNRDLIAYRILGMDENAMTTRRWYFYIPAEGEPTRLAHSVERSKLDSLPGRKLVYLPWEQQHALLKEILGPPKKIMMQYSPMNNIPYVSMVDGGTIELIRSFGHEIVSSADLVQTFEAVIGEEGYRSHLEACDIVLRIKDEAYDEIRKSVRNNSGTTEYDIAQFILRRFEEEGMFTHDSPIVGVNDHPSDPHFEPTRENARPFKEGDCVLIDLWAKMNRPKAIYFDVTWCGFIGQNPPEKYLDIWKTVVRARKSAVQFIRDKFARGETCFGWEVDDACRNVVKEAGYGDHFVHRTGHSIGEEVHGNGVHIDNLETKEERQIIPGICFSIEPGIYFDGEMAARTEINVFITLDGEVVVAGDEQEDLILI